MFRAALAATAAACAIIVGTAPEPARSSSAIVAPAVGAALRQAEDVRVIVELTEPPMQPTERTDRGRLRARLARAQNDLIDDLPAANTKIVRQYEGLPGIVVEADAAGIAALSAHPRVKSIVADVMGEGALQQSVPMINADDVRDGYGITGAGVTVAVLDSGIDSNHPDLLNAIAYERCYLIFNTCPGGGTTGSGPGSAEDDHGHGTHITGIITSDGVTAAKGVAPGAQIAVYKVLNASNQGWISDWEAALSDIVANHPEVDAVNMSLVDNTNHGACDASFPVTASAINSLRSNGVPTFVASGNNGFTNGITYPACINGAIAVGAVWDFTAGGPLALFTCSEVPVMDNVTCWSNSSPLVDVLAPGGVIAAPLIGGGVIAGAGTSQATPHTTGVAAQLLQVDPTLTVNQIEAALENGGVPRTDGKNGITKPRIDALGALLEIADPDDDTIPSFVDNCPTVYNISQSNSDANFIDHSPPYNPNVDDKTVPNSDTFGNACDTDDDNDGLADLDEASGTLCLGNVTNPVVGDFDGDRFLDGAECALGTDPTSSASKPLVTACGATTDADGDKLTERIEICFYGTSPNNSDADGDKATTGGKDGCEAASLNGDRIVNVADMGMLATAISNAAFRVVSVDVNKDGVWNPADQGLVASFISPSGQCPG